MANTWLRIGVGAGLLATGLLAGCTKHTVKVEPIEVKPMTLNVNIRVEREVEQLFDFKTTPVAETTDEGSTPPAEGETP